MCVCVCVWMTIYIYIYRYIERERESEKTDRQTNRVGWRRYEFWGKFPKLALK